MVHLKNIENLDVQNVCLQERGKNCLHVMMKLMVCELLINILVSFIIQITTNVYLNYK